MEECINLTPVDDSGYDAATIRTRLLENEHVIEDVRTTERLQVVCGADAQDYARRCREESEENSFVGGIIVIRRDLVHFAPTEASRKAVETMRELAQWVIDNYPSKISGLVVGDDWTERCAGRVDPMFEPELPRRP